MLVMISLFLKTDVSVLDLSICVIFSEHTDGQNQNQPTFKRKWHCLQQSMSMNFHKIDDLPVLPSSDKDARRECCEHIIHDFEAIIRDMDVKLLDIDVKIRETALNHHCKNLAKLFGFNDSANHHCKNVILGSHFARNLHLGPSLVL